MTAPAAAPKGRPQRRSAGAAGSRAAKPLTVVRPKERARRHRRSAPLLTLLAVLLVGAGLLGVVASHVALAQGQLRLQRLEAHAAEEQARYERLRLQVAELESPTRIVSAAQERLGMVPPPGVTYLSPSGPVDDKAAPGRAVAGSSEAAAMDDWSNVKQQLAGR